MKLPDNSLIRKKVLAIIAMECAGKSHTEIAAELGIKEKTIRQYKFIAGKKGWLTSVDPRDQLEYNLGHKIVENFKEALDSPDPARKDKMTVELAKGTIFKKFDAQASVAPPMSALTINIVNAPTEGGSAPTVRVGTMHGTPKTYTDAQVVEENNKD
jgi:hypothetical protein